MQFYFGVATVGECSCLEVSHLAATQDYKLLQDMVPISSAQELL